MNNFKKMSRLRKIASPEIGESVKLTDDKRYKSDSTLRLSLLDERDAPVIVMNGKVYYGEDGTVTHQELLTKALEENGLKEDDWIPDLAFAYYVENFLGSPSVFITKDQNYDNQAQVIKNDRPDLNVYVIDTLTDILTRVAANLNK